MPITKNVSPCWTSTKTLCDNDKRISYIFQH